MYTMFQLNTAILTQLIAILLLGYLQDFGRNCKRWFQEITKFSKNVWKGIIIKVT